MTTYLAGPMMGCTDEEMYGWRKIAANMLKDISDPTVRDYRGITDQHVEEIVQSDKSEIDKCDYVLAYCPRASYGTIMEIIYSWERDKTVVVVVPPGVDISPWLHYHSHIILNSVEQACKYIKGMKALNPTNTKEKKTTMSNNKFRYYNVTTTTVVQANNKTDALALARGRRGVPGRAISGSNEVERIPAGEAHALAQSVTA